MAETVLFNALREAIDEEMARDSTVFLLGEDVGHYGGSYKVTKDLYKKYPSKITEINRKLYSEIAIIWKTDELKRTKPSPLDEAKWGLAVIEDSLWDTIPKVYKRLNDIFRNNLKKDLPRNFNPIQFGSWMGGDRDGNPFVTTDITLKTSQKLRSDIIKNYYRDIRDLRRRLTFKGIEDVIVKIEDDLYRIPIKLIIKPLLLVLFSQAWFVSSS